MSEDMGTPASSKALSLASTSGSSWDELLGAIQIGNSKTQKLIKGLGHRVKTLEESQLRTGRIVTDARHAALEVAGQQDKVNKRLEGFRVKVDSFLPMRNCDMIKAFDKALFDSAIEASFNNTTDKVIIILCLSRVPTFQDI
jgi:hypothetical protein